MYGNGGHNILYIKINTYWHTDRIRSSYEIIPFPIWCRGDSKFRSIYWRSIEYSCGSIALQWCHNDHDGISNHQPHGCLLNCLFRRRSKETSKLRATGLCVGNSPVDGKLLCIDVSPVSMCLLKRFVSERLTCFGYSNICQYISMVPSNGGTLDTFWVCMLTASLI